MLLRSDSILQHIIVCIFCFCSVGVHLYISGLIDLMDFVDSTWAAQGLGSKVVWLWIFSIGMRCKYYFAWKLAEAACNASGLGMRVVKDKSSGSPAVVWDRCVGCVPLKVEWPWSSVNVPRYWVRCPDSSIPVSALPLYLLARCTIWSFLYGPTSPACLCLCSSEHVHGKLVALLRL
eukprot:SAG31_NODE_2385_length_5819_cov_3.572902_5_plen_177_part_00